MGNTSIAVDLRIIGADSNVDRFVEQWLDSGDFVEAHTSGSTGVPKLIQLRKADMVESARATCQRFGIDASSHLVMPLSADYIAGKMMVVRAMVSGARLTVLPSSRALAGLDGSLGRIDLLPVVPTQIEALLRSETLCNIRNVIVGGAPLSPAQEDAVKRAGINAYATYGMTETCSHVAVRRVGQTPEYEAMPGISFETDSDGALIIVASRYSAGRFLTNDMVRLIDSRHFVWLGRRDNVVNSGGVKIHPEQVEAMLRPWLDDAEFYLTGRTSEIWGQELVLVTTAPESSVKDALLKGAREIPHRLLPKAVIHVDTMQYTSSGKIKRIAADML